MTTITSKALEKLTPGSLSAGRSITLDAPITITVHMPDGNEFYVNEVKEINCTSVTPTGHISLLCYQVDGSITLIPASYLLIVFG